MNVLHILVSGGTGGIETLCKDFVQFSSHSNHVVCLWQGGCVFDEMKALGIDAVQLPTPKKAVFQALMQLRDICKKNKIDVVIAHHAAPMSHIYIMLLKLMIPNIKTIAYAHGNAEDMYVRKRKKGVQFRRLVLKASLHFADHVIAISKSVAASLVRDFDLAQNKIEIIYNGVNAADFQKKESNGCTNMGKSPEFNMIYVGRLIQEKGVQTTIKALAELKSDISWKFKVVGDGPYREALEELVSRLHLTDRVEFLGNRRDVANLLEQADCFIHMPEWEEGFGITIIEAMAAGKICICANKGAVSEIIQDGVSGILVNSPVVPSELANIIEKTYRESTQHSLSMLRENAQKRANDFSIEQYVRAVDSLIEH